MVVQAVHEAYSFGNFSKSPYVEGCIPPSISYAAYPLQMDNWNQSQQIQTRGRVQHAQVTNLPQGYHRDEQPSTLTFTPMAIQISYLT